MILWKTFDQNEIYILVALVIVYTAFFVLPKRFPRQISLLFLTWGFATATLFDFTLGGEVMGLYTVNDSGQYELMDLLSYFLFAPFSYFFVYFYHYFQIGRKSIIFYIVGWTILGSLMEQLSRFMEMTHYGDGYNAHYSIVIFLVVQTTTALYYELIIRQQRQIGNEQT